MSVALAASLQFIRAEGFVFSHVADEGLIATACAGDLLRYRDLKLLEVATEDLGVQVGKSVHILFNNGTV